MSGTGTVTLQQPASNRGATTGPSTATRTGDRIERESFISEVPKWIEVEHLPWKERCEIQLYKLVSLVPVSVTFCLYFYLFIYYAIVSTLPGRSCLGSFIVANFLNKELNQPVNLRHLCLYWLKFTDDSLLFHLLPTTLSPSLTFDFDTYL